MYLAKWRGIMKNSIVFLGILFSGCATYAQYVVLREVPLHPSFTVIPNSFKDEDSRFADLIANALIVNRVSVIERPSMIDSITTVEAGQKGWNPNTGLLGVATGSGVKGKATSGDRRYS